MTSSASPYALALFTAFALIGCLPTGQDGTSSSSGGSSGSSGSSGDGGAEGGTTTAGQACLDTATAFATAAKRCGGDYDAERTAFIKDLANGDCNSVSIRNEAELRNQCIPSFASISCSDLTQQRFAPSCAEQIIRDK
ncbi:MAG: hypothetical protein JWP87_861 [Labilithrix sp.]|nr:hypothetical protein [Labilithrix sp.]